MRILHVIQCTNLGGMEQTALLQTVGLLERGHHCRVVSLNPIGKLGPLLASNEIPAMGLAYRGWAGVRSLPLMWRAFRSEPADAVVMTGHNLAGMMALGDLCKRRRLLCIHYHHTGVKPDWQWRLIYRLAVRQFPAVTFPSDFVRREAENLCAELAAISHTVRNPFVVPELPSLGQRQAARESLGIPQEVPVVGNAGWLIPRKRWDVFLRVAAHVATAVKDVQFLVAGDGALRSSLTGLAESLGLSGRVRWLGWQDDLGPFFAAVDVMHFNSDWDAAPRSPTEALAYGVPLVASVLHGGLAEIVDREEYGYVCPSHDEAWLAQKIVFLLQDPEARRRMGLAGRARLSEIGSPKLHVQKIARLLDLEEALA